MSRCASGAGCSAVVWRPRRLRGTGTEFDGRMVDFGASYFTATDSDFRVVVDELVDAGFVRPWTDAFHVAGIEGIEGVSSGPYALRRACRTAQRCRGTRVACTRGADACAVAGRRNRAHLVRRDRRRHSGRRHCGLHTPSAGRTTDLGGPRQHSPVGAGDRGDMRVRAAYVDRTRRRLRQRRLCSDVDRRRRQPPRRRGAGARRARPPGALSPSSGRPGSGHPCGDQRPSADPGADGASRNGSMSTGGPTPSRWSGATRSTGSTTKRRSEWPATRGQVVRESRRPG